MICSSLNRDRFIVRSFSGAGLYSSLEEVQGLRSVLSHNDAREGFRNALHSVHLESSLLEEDIQAEFETAKIGEVVWLLTKTTDEGVEVLTRMESDIITFQGSLSRRYRKVFDARRKGIDHLL